MVKKILKTRSKRTTIKTRVKQEKKLREHNAKARRDKRKNPGKYRKSKKDPGVPNSCPFKEDVLREVEFERKRKQEMKEKKRDEIKQRREEAKTRQLDEIRAKGLSGLVRAAEKKQAAHDYAEAAAEAQDQDFAEPASGDRTAKAYYKEFTKVLEAADVILQVLDARDPLGTRCKEMENAVIESSKRLVLVLNKADLVPKENLEKWLKYLRKEFPSVAFKASTQAQGNRLGQSGWDVTKCSDDQLKTSNCVGSSTLMALLGNYCRNKDIKTSIRVGVVGLPNVGKSSLINSLKRSRACGVGATPGVTKRTQEIQLDSKIKLLDSPGMILAAGSLTDASISLKNALKVESLKDPVTPVEAILQRCPKQRMMLQYSVPDFDTTLEFLSLVARGIGRLKKGGVPDQEAAARLVLNDWNCGKIKYFTHPPTPEDDCQPDASDSEIVGGFSKEFNLDDLDKMETADISLLPTVLQSQTMLVETAGQVAEAKIEEEEEEEDIAISEDEITPEVCRKKGKRDLSNIALGEVGKGKGRGNQDQHASGRLKEEGLLRLKKLSKVREKKQRKERRRTDRLDAELSHGLEAALNTM